MSNTTVQTINHSSCRLSYLGVGVGCLQVMMVRDSRLRVTRTICSWLSKRAWITMLSSCLYRRDKYIVGVKSGVSDKEA